MTRKQLKSINPFKAARAVKAHCRSALVSLQVKAVGRAASIIADRYEVDNDRILQDFVIDSIVCRLTEEVDARAIASEMNHGEVAKHLRISAEDVAGAFSVEDIAECIATSDVAGEIDSIDLANDVADQFMGDIVNGVSEMMDWDDMDYRKLAASLLSAIQNPGSEDS